MSTKDKLSKFEIDKYDRWIKNYIGTDEEAKAEALYYKMKYHQKCGEMGHYKQTTAKEVREREKIVESKERKLQQIEKTLDTTTYEKIIKKEEYLKKREVEIENIISERKWELDKKFNDAKEKIIDLLSKELINWTENYDIDNQRSQGYIIGINKAKKIIREEMTLYDKRALKLL